MGRIALRPIHINLMMEKMCIAPEGRKKVAPRRKPVVGRHSLLM
ncbi:MAG TPA: hypothetical protein VEY08_00710 [Chloroflexia bacterium]|nr:hypothetical protein [Chloroflexia bacterium]